VVIPEKNRIKQCDGEVIKDLKNLTCNYQGKKRILNIQRKEFFFSLENSFFTVLFLRLMADDLIKIGSPQREETFLSASCTFLFPSLDTEFAATSLIEESDVVDKVKDIITLLKVLTLYDSYERMFLMKIC